MHPMIQMCKLAKEIVSCSINLYVGGYSPTSKYSWWKGGIPQQQQRHRLVSSQSQREKREAKK